jgi:hypothetical protein
MALGITERHFRQHVHYLFRDALADLCKERLTCVRHSLQAVRILGTLQLCTGEKPSKRRVRYEQRIDLVRAMDAAVEEVERLVLCASAGPAYEATQSRWVQDKHLAEFD